MVKGGREGKLEKKEKWKMEKTMALVADVRRAGMRERIFPFHTKPFPYQSNTFWRDISPLGI